MIFHSHKTIFFHIGKTAGVSIENAFDNGPRNPNVADFNTFYGYDPESGIYLQHATPALMQRVTPADIFENYFKFTVVRNPFDRVVSVYHYLIDQHSEEYGSFENFVHNLDELMSRPQARLGSHYLSQFNYCHIDKQCVCDAIIYFENLPSSFDQIRIRTGLDSELGHHNKNLFSDWKHKPVHEHFNATTADVVRTLYKADFDFFGYSSDPKITAPIKAMKSPPH